MNQTENRILIVDDEEDLCEILQFNLNNHGFIAHIAHSAEEALESDISQFDLILLDIMMGEMSGFDMAKAIRDQGITVPIIFLTALTGEMDILDGFDLGADDYITKPFSINELIARVKAVINRSAPQNGKKNKPILKFNDIELDLEHKRLIVSGEKKELTKKEFEIIKLLLENQGSVYSRENFLSLIWGKDVIVTERTVDVNIARLRSKLCEYGKCLKNKTGYGYYFEW
ncbi:MAG: response regulator transcription factor [Bacteroidales bacterium]|jgi:two-component system alkaline phosphatase synthesis response regulator PhoP